MEIIFECLYCGVKNTTTDTAIDEYIGCEQCEGLHDIEINDDGEVVVQEF